MKIESFENWLKSRKNGGPVFVDHHFQEVSDDGNRMIKNNLNDILDYTKELLDNLTESSQLEEWMENKITVARTYLSDVAHAYMNDLKSGSCGEPELDSAQDDLGYESDIGF